MNGLRAPEAQRADKQAGWAWVGQGRPQQQGDQKASLLAERAPGHCAQQNVC